MAPDKLFFLSLLVAALALTSEGAATQMGPIYGEDVIIKGSGHKRLKGQDTLEVVPQEATVVDVLRGNILVVTLQNGRRVKFRLLGIACQEPGEPWGAPAIDFTKKMTLAHSGLALSVGAGAGAGAGDSMEGFFIIDNRSVGVMLIRRGLAQLSTDEHRFKARGTFSRYRRAQMGAIASRKGMWGWPRPQKAQNAPGHQKPHMGAGKERENER